MRKTAPGIALHSDPAQKRRWPRKNVLSSGIIADVNGDNASDCTIHDINAHGAQVGFSNELPAGEQVYLLDISNRTAYLARVAWKNSDRAGLSFVQTHTLGFAPKPGLTFLWRLLLEGKLREVERIVAKGVPVGLACRTVGLAEAHLDQMAQYASADEKFARLIASAKRLMNTHSSSN